MSSRGSFLFLLWGLCLISSFDYTISLKTKPKGGRKPLSTKIQQNATLPFNKSQNDSSLLHLSSKILQITGTAFENQVTVLSIPSNSDIVVGKDVAKGAKVILECSAPFPVQWIYTGDGMPEISTNTSILKKSLISGEFTATAALGFNRNLQESDTGEYVCRSVQNPQESIYYFIYVPGKSLFTSAKGHGIKVHDSQNFVRIPCSVTHPEVLVTLQKKVDGFLQCPVKNSVSFSPKTGFQINIAPEIDLQEFHDDDPSGEYICIGGLNGSFQLLEYSVKRISGTTFLFTGENPFDEQDEDDSLETAKIHARDEGQCYQNPCGLNSICRTISGNILPVCKCKFGYNGSPPNCRSESKSVCSPSPCGPNSRCQEIRGINGKNLPHCSCLPAYIGRPPNCRPECLLNLDCPLAMACINQQCEDPCDTDEYCGKGAICQVRDHIPICSCPPGYSGDPSRFGKCGRSRIPSLNYFPPSGSRPGYPNDPKPNESEIRFACDPWPCGPFSECKPVGENAHCSCAPGYIGLPPNCRPECRRDIDCSTNRACIEAKCRDPCLFSRVKCGHNAECYAVNYQAECQCRAGFRGNPLIKCTKPNAGQNNNHQGDQSQEPVGHGPISGQFPQSPSSSEEYPISPPSYPMRPVVVGAGYPGMMIMGSPPPADNKRPPARPTNPNPNNDFPCRNSPCGKQAICSFRNQTIGCKCPGKFTGFGSDPYVECYPSSNPCEICGPHSRCEVRKNRQPVCSCLPGKTGSPPNCRDTFSCQRNRDCLDDHACHRDQCVDPCQWADCNQFAVCRGVKHQPVCACPNAPDKDPLYGCPPTVFGNDNRYP